MSRYAFAYFLGAAFGVLAAALCAVAARGDQ